MYKVGDLVVYGSIGVCRVEGVGVPSSTVIDTIRDYYTLAPVYKGGHIYAPTDTSVFMRPVISRDTALALIERMPDIDGCIYESRQMNLLKEHYQALLRSHDCVDLVHVIKSVHVKRQSLAKDGKCLGQVEAQYMRQAEDMLHDELAIALDIPRGDVRTYLEDALESAPRRESCGTAGGTVFIQAEAAC